MMKLDRITRRKFLQSLGIGALGLLLPKSRTSNAAHSLVDQTSQLGRILLYQLPIHVEPNLRSRTVGFYRYDDIIRIPEISYVQIGEQPKRGWYQLASDRYLEAAWVQPVRNRPNRTNQEIPNGGCLGEITIPKIDVHNQPNLRNIHRTFYYENTFWVLRRIVDKYNIAWYELLDDYAGGTYYVKSYAVRLVNQDELAPISPEIAPNQKRLELDLYKQIVRAFEKGHQVWEAPVSTGRVDGTTPVGRWYTNRKRPCRRMVSEPGNPLPYDLPGVPWVSYITLDGVAFHGAFWHSNWGYVMSNGCINMTSQDAKWIYRWTNPEVPFHKYYYYEDTGTPVDVITGFGRSS